MSFTVYPNTAPTLNVELFSGSTLPGLTLFPVTALPFDNIPMTHAGLWDLQKQRTDYTGYAVRAGLAADSGATTLDIGFTAQGEFDMAAYSAFGTGSERIVTWYDQSGNGFDLTRAWSATLCPIIRTSSYNSLPCVYFSQGSLGNAAFTDWNSLADCNLVAAINYGAANGLVFSGNTGTGRSTYAVDGSPQYWFVNGWSSYNTFTSIMTKVGQINRWLFDGGAATDLLRAPYSKNNVSQSGSAGAAIGTTLPASTGIWLNGAQDGNGGGAGSCNAEYWGAYYIGQDITAEWTTLYNAILTQKFGASSLNSNLWINGDSLSVSYNTNVTDITQAWPNLLNDGLETLTGTTWTVGNFNGTTAEVAADLARILQLFNANIKPYRDSLKANDICTLWGGTNDLAAGTAAATALTSFTSALTAIYDAGFVMSNGLVPCLNMLPRTDLGAGNAAFESKRTTFNSGFAAAIAGKGMLIDVAAITELADSTNLTYYIDGVHPSTLGYSLIYDAVLDAITPYIN
jgi:lysophospholipase L1-like esterase